MTIGFSSLPQVVIDYVRDVFARANDKMARALIDQPALHEPTLDNLLILELTVSPPAFFAREQVAVSIETHWLGGRWMYDRFEIADIALFITLRRQGQLGERKVALLQTKRLYSRDIPVADLDDADFAIGIGRLVDRAEPLRPLTQQRAFSFTPASTYDATASGHEQIGRIDAYMKAQGIPVFYGLYNPLVVPFQGVSPAAPGATGHLPNSTGCRILPAGLVHNVMNTLPLGRSPSFADLTLAAPIDSGDADSAHGWRLERFVADEVLRCRQGRLFDQTMDPNLDALLYRRTAPITAAIQVTIDFAPGGG
jgi:hypothetical protein